jgi:hypothetical protein
VTVDAGCSTGAEADVPAHCCTGAPHRPGAQEEAKVPHYGARPEACVVLAVTLPVPPVWKAAFIAGAVLLPWFGVVMANAGPTVARDGASALLVREVVPPVRLAVEPGRVVDQE